MAGQQGQNPRPTTLITLGERLLGHASIFTVGIGFDMVLGLARVVVLTRLLEIAVYGQFTILVITAGLVTMLSRMALVTGSLMAAFRGGDDEVDAAEQGSPPVDSREDQRRILGTGLVGSMLLTAVLVGFAAAFAEPIDEFLIHSGSQFAVVAAVLLGGLDGSYRLLSHVPRFERRPVIYVSLQLANSILGFAFAVVLIEAGYGLEGAIGGLALGSAVSFLPALWISRHRFAPSLDLKHLAGLFRTGLPYMAITGSFFLIREADVFMISRYMSNPDVALYRVAARVGGLASALVTGVVLAWGPLMRGPLRGALHREGLIVTAGARLLTYFWLSAVCLLVALAVMQKLLIHIAPPAYRDAAYLIPLIGLAALSTASLLMVYRTSRLPGKRAMLIKFLLPMPLMLVGLAMLLIPPLGVNGAVIAGIVPPLGGAAIYLLVSQRTSPQPLDLPWRRLILATAVGVVYSAVGVFVVDALAGPGEVLSIALAMAFPGILVLIRTIPVDEARTLFKFVRVPKPGRSGSERDLALLNTQDLMLLQSLLREQRPPAEVARESERTEGEVLGHFVTLLREIGDIGQPQENDVTVARYLLAPTNINLRDRIGHLLALEQGVESMELDELTAAADRIRRMSERRWSAAVGPDVVAQDVERVAAQPP